MSDQPRHLSRADLAKLDPEETTKALHDGTLAHLLDPRSVTADDLRGWVPEDVNAARAEGRLKHLGIEPDEAHTTADRIRDSIRGKSPEAVADLLGRGDLDAVLRGDVD